MTINELKKIVYEKNLSLVKNDLVILTWGNVSMADRKLNVFVIKPSGVSYDKLKPEDMVVVSLETGKKISGKFNPSSDTPTHYALYKKFPKINGIVHTHSTFATAFAQAQKEIPILGTTHADCFYESIPCVNPLTKSEVEKDYEYNTGLSITKYFKNNKIDYESTPAALLANHGPFTWGKDAHEALKNAITLEEVAKMAFLTLSLDKNSLRLKKYILEKHYNRKHGKNSYYGQSK